MLLGVTVVLDVFKEKRKNIFQIKIFKFIFFLYLKYLNFKKHAI
jgi:hypothetical protein